MKDGVHDLKSSSGYVGAGYLYYACCYILEAYKRNDFDGMARYYPLLVEAVIEFKRFSRKVIAEHNGK